MHEAPVHSVHARGGDNRGVKHSQIKRGQSGLHACLSLTVCVCLTQKKKRVVYSMGYFASKAEDVSIGNDLTLRFDLLNVFESKPFTLYRKLPF